MNAKLVMFNTIRDDHSASNAPRNTGAQWAIAS